MIFTLKKTPPNPNGNPNFKRQWENFSENSPVKLPRELHALFKDLTTALNSGQIKVTDLERVIGQPRLEIVPLPEIVPPDIMQILQHFEDSQVANWGDGSTQEGEFNTDSPCWTKYNEFKVWAKSLVL
jgi:hypothetical protein